MTNSVDVCTFVDSVMHDEYLHGQESINGGSLESELAKSPSPVPVDFPIKQHISEKSQGNSNQKKGTGKGTADSRRTKSVNGKQSLSERCVWSLSG